MPSLDKAAFTATGGKPELMAADAQIAVLARALIDKNGNVTHNGNAAEVTPVSPVTTQVVNFNNRGENETLYLTPAGTIAAMTLVFPSDAQSRIGQIVRVCSTQIVTALTVTSTNLTLIGTAVTALAANAAPLGWQKVAASTWIALQ